MRRLIVAGAILLGCISGLSPRADAHVLLTDDMQSAGAILHIIPDDDPIAGELSDIFFEIRSDVLTTQDYNFELLVKDEDGVLQEVNTVASGAQGVSAVFVFPRQGVYELELVAQSIGSRDRGPAATFRHVQRVSRGTAAMRPPETQSHSWAEIGVVMALSSMMVILIIIINRRATIAQFTREESKRR